MQIKKRKENFAEEILGYLVVRTCFNLAATNLSFSLLPSSSIGRKKQKGFYVVWLMRNHFRDSLPTRNNWHSRFFLPRWYCDIMEFSNITCTPSQPWQIQKPVNLAFLKNTIHKALRAFVYMHTQCLCIHTLWTYTPTQTHTFNIDTLLNLCRPKASLKLVQISQA